MFKNKPKKLVGKNFKFEETVYELSRGKGVGDEAELALVFHQGGTTAQYYGRALNHDDTYIYSVDGLPGTFERIADAMEAIVAAHNAS